MFTSSGWWRTSRAKRKSRWASCWCPSHPPGGAATKFESNPANQLDWANQNALSWKKLFHLFLLIFTWPTTSFSYTPLSLSFPSSPPSHHPSLCPLLLLLLFLLSLYLLLTPTHHLPLLLLFFSSSFSPPPSLHLPLTPSLSFFLLFLFLQEFLLKLFCVFRNLMKLSIFPRDWNVMRLLTSKWDPTVTVSMWSLEVVFVLWPPKCTSSDDVETARMLIESNLLQLWKHNVVFIQIRTTCSTHLASISRSTCAQ